ncbi:unnamed protein product [Rotaria magnacalcarata]
MAEAVTEKPLEEELRQCNETYGTENFTTDKTVRSEIHEESSYIGIHASLDKTIKFIPSDGTVQAGVSGVDERVPVELPEISSEYNSSSATIKVKQLLRNFHFCPIYEKKSSRKVSFRLTSPQDKTWEKQDNILSLPDHSVWICRRNNTISYAYANTVTTWDWSNNTFALTSYPTTKITALAENVEADLVVGDEKGNLFIYDKMIPTEQASIEKISYVCSVVCLLKFEGGSEQLFNVELKKLISIPQTNGQKFRILDNGMVVRWHENEINVLEYDPAERQWKLPIPYSYEDIKDILVIPNAKFMIAHENHTGTLWDVRQKLSFTKNKKYVSIVTKNDIGQNLLFIETETLVYDRSLGSKVQLCFHSDLENNKNIEAEKAGLWYIDVMILLSDGSIMYATNTRDSGIHVVTRDGKIVFTKSVKEFLKDEKIDSLKELGDGSVAVECSRSIFILKPQMLSMRKNVYDTIKRLKKNLRNDPTDLELYSKLAKRYMENDPISEEPYQLYLSGLEAAAKSSNFYQARRFYEKARQIKPICSEPCQLFLSYVKITPYKQLMRRIHLDLFALTKVANDLPNDLKSRRCKTRLLIGEGDFSFTSSLIDKHEVTHPNLRKAIIATDLKATHLQKLSKDQDKKKKVLEKRIVDLKQRGVNVLFGVDAKEIHQTFKGRRFKRIQWNCPFGESTSTARKEFTDTIPKFFQSCSRLQLPNDRVHVTLMQKSDEYWKERQIENRIVHGSATAGYRLIRKRSFGTPDKKRYPNYTHVKTNTTKPYNAGGEENEFIFEKTDTVLPVDSYRKSCKLMDSHKKIYAIRSNNATRKPPLEECYFECSTDEDSSDYYESDSGEDL